ncbi:MAG: hypothetical protein CMK78_12555 [Pseudomonadales bacterium]|nr:hypothetical protein [Pseudomonadales bacterium]
MRVLLMAPDQLKSRVGGLRTQVERTAEELRGLGVDVVEFNPWFEYAAGDYDLVHVFSMNTPTYFKAEIFKGALPIVFSSVMWRTSSRMFIRAMVEIGVRSPFMLLNDVISCRKMSEWATRVLPNTTQELEWLVQAVGVTSDKCHVVPNGADDHFSDLDVDALDGDFGAQFPEDFVFCASVISSRKNLVRLAISCEKNSFPLVLAGPVVDVDVKRKLDEMVLGGAKITFVGGLDNHSELLGYLYHRCRVFCLPSFYETPGIAALEAGLTGARVVVTEVGGAQDYFMGMASYINPYDQNDIDSKLSRAWALERDPILGEKLRTHILKEFSWRSVAEKTLLNYRLALEDV